MFSLHLDHINVKNNALYGSDWIFVPDDCPHKIAKITHKYASSPIVWLNGRRRKEHFLKANWIGVDFDTGAFLLEEALETFKEYTHVIGTSQNHQLPKPSRNDPTIVAPPCDRFHVFLKLPETIISCTDYEAIVRFYVDKYMGDRARIDGASKFKPCREIISVVERNPIPIRRKTKYTAFSKPRVIEQGVPRWIRQLLEYGPAFGESRNTTCFKIAVNLKNKYSLEDIVSMLMSSAIPISQNVRDEVTRTVNSAFSYK